MMIRNALILAASCAVCTLAAGADFPARKPGLWLITMNMGNPKIPPRTQKVCLDAATNQMLYKLGAGASQKMCSKVDISGAGGKLVVDSVCSLGSTKAGTHSVTTMMGDSAFHTDVSSHYDPPMFGKADSSMTQDGKWAGVCPADMRPGDVQVDTAPGAPPIKMNLNDMFKDSK